MYVPGPILKACNNELVLLELSISRKADPTTKGVFSTPSTFSFASIKGALHRCMVGSSAGTQTV